MIHIRRIECAHSLSVLLLILLLIISTFPATTFLLPSFASTICYSQVDVRTTPQLGLYTFAGSVAATSATSITLFPIGYKPPGVASSAVWLTRPTYWTSGFKATFDVKLSLETNGTINGYNAPPGLAFVLSAANGQPTPPSQIQGAEANQLGYGGLTSTIALEIDLVVDSNLGDSIAPGVSLHTLYAASNTAGSNAVVPAIPLIPLTFTLKSQTINMSIEYIASSHRFDYCVGTDCASATLDVNQFNFAFNSASNGGGDGNGYFGFVGTSSDTQFGGMSISNFNLTTVQPSPSLSFISGPMVSPGATFTVSSTPSLYPSGQLCASDTCGNQLLTSSSPLINITTSYNPNSQLNFYFNVKNTYDGVYNIFIWSKSCSEPNTSVTLTFTIDKVLIKAPTTTVAFVPVAISINYPNTLASISLPSSLLVGAQSTHTILFLDSEGKRISAPATFYIALGWSDTIQNVQNVDLSNQMNYTFTITSSVPRNGSSMSYQITLGTTSPATLNPPLKQNITVTTPPNYGVTWGPLPVALVATLPTLTNTLALTLYIGNEANMQGIPADFIFGRLYYIKTLHPTMSAPRAFGELLSTTVLPGNSTPGTRQLRFFQDSSTASSIAGLFNFTVWFGSTLVNSFNFTIQPRNPIAIQVATPPPAYYSPQTNLTTTAHFFILDQYSNWNYLTSYGSNMQARFTGGGIVQFNASCGSPGQPIASVGYSAQCIYNTALGSIDVLVGIVNAAQAGSAGTIQLMLSGSSVGAPLPLKFGAGVCASCTSYQKISQNVTANDFIQFDMLLNDTANQPFLARIVNFTVLPATPADWQGLFSITSSPFPGRFVVKGQVASSLSYSKVKLSVLTPVLDGVAAPPVNVSILPVSSSTTLCLNYTQYSNVPSFVAQGDNIIFDMTFFDCQNQSFISPGKLSIVFALSPNLAVIPSIPQMDSTKPNLYHVTIIPWKITSPAIQLKLTPSIPGYTGLLPLIPPITINSSLPVCVECTLYSALPTTVQQGDNMTFLIFLYNSTLGAPLLKIPSDFDITVDPNPSLYTTPALTKEVFNYRLTTRFVVNPAAGNITFAFQIKIYGVYAPAMKQITVMPLPVQQPIICAACTTYGGADGVGAMSTTVPSGGILTFTLFLRNADSIALGLLLPTSSITFDLPTGMQGYHVSANPAVDTKYTITIPFNDIGPTEPPTSILIKPIVNGIPAPDIYVTLLPSVYCPTCTRYAQQSTTIIPAGEQFKLSILLYASDGFALGSYLPVENVTVVGAEVFKSIAVVRNDIPTGQTAPAPAKLAATGGVVKASAGTASGYEISVTFNTPNSALSTSISVALNGVSINRPIALTLRPPVPPTDQPDPCLDIDPRLTCPDQSRQCLSAVVLLPNRGGGKNYTYECRDILKIQKILPPTTWSNVSTPITVTLMYDLPANLHLTLNGHDIFPLNPSVTDSRIFTFIMPSAVDLNYTILHNQTNGLRVNFSLSAHVGAYDYALSDIPSPGLTLLPTPCVSEGTYWIPATDACLPCPSHAYCPGGQFIYPLPGYYSTGDKDPTVTKCLVADACNGFSPDDAGETEFSADNQCNTDAGYQGNLCSDCDSNHYKQELVCRSCGLDDAAQKQLILVLIVALVVFGVMSFGVAFIKDEKLAIYITIIVFIQQCSFVGSIGSSKLSSGGLAAFFQFLSLLNFEVAYFKLGCTVPQITYVKVFWATILMMIVAALMLTIASGLFAYTRSEEYLRLKGAERSKVFSRRMQNSMTILGVVVYLQLTTQFFKGLFCVEINDQHVLQVEPSTVCYEGGHLITAIFIWPLLFAYSCGFPILCFWLVMRTRSLNLWSSSAAKFVYLYRGLKIRFIYFKQFNFVTSFALALQITLSTTSNVTVRLATAFLFFSLNVFLVGVFWPYYKKFQNWLAIVAGLANALSGLLILTVLSKQVNQDSSKLGDLEGIGLFFLGFGVLTFFVLLIFPARYLSKKYLPGKETTEDDELLQSGHYDELAASRTSKGLGTNPLDAKRQAKTIKTIETDSSTIELQKQRAESSSPFDNASQKKSATNDFNDNNVDANGLTSPSAATHNNNNDNNNNKSTLPPPLPPTSSFSPPPLSSPSDYPSPPMSPHSDLPIHDHSAAQSDELPTDVVVQSSDIELHQPIPSQPKFDADEYEREHEEGLL